MSHHDIFRLGLYHLDTMGWHKTIPPKKDGDEKKVVTMSSCITVEAKFWHASENTEKIIISNGKDKEHTFDSDILTARKLPSLIKYGHSINENYIKDLSYALQLMRDELPTSDLYDGSGIIETPHGYIVMIDTIYTSKQYDQLSSLDPIVDSAYPLEPKGTFKDWLNMYINEVKGHLLLELAVVFGISALVTSFLKYKREIEFAGIIFSFTGQSSTGKSTAAALAVSVAGNPTKGNQTLFRGWNATRNALESYLSNNFGIPIVFDELSSATFKDTTGLLYSITEGQGRQRSNVHGEVKTPKNWGTSVISTSEYSIFNDSAQNDGLRVRTIIAEGQGRQRSNVHGEVKTPKNWGTSVISTSEYSIFTDSAQNDGLRVRTIEINEQFTTNATNADNIKKAVALNYGHVLPLVAIDYHAHTVSERSLADKAIEVITQFVAQNRGKFSDDTALKNMFENYGLIALKDNHIEVKIIASVFKNMLLEHHFQDVNNVVNALRDKGFIESDHDRITTKRTVKDGNGKKQSLVFYHLKLDSEYASIFGLTKDAEPIKAEINLDNKKILESWKKQNDDLIDF
uniref:SCCmec staphylococcal cassette region, isolate CMFT283 n=1 Tax=Staphylococcus aureus TaxID=1280 RepID=M1XHS3_STAAU|nr:unnamed protein product [Staphylococcus aureus]